MILMPDEFTVTQEQEEDWVRRHIDDPGQLALVADVSGGIVGLAHLESGTRRRLVHRAVIAVSVAAAWRGQGVGAALFHELLGWAETHPLIEKLSLAVLAENRHAIALYRKFGFIEEGRRLREIKLDHGQYADDILMCRWVGPTPE
jgi:RimJ/RimL family protein N-acetyltransferase